MQMLGNLVLGAALAGVLAGPPAWTDASHLLCAGVSEARMVIGGTGNNGSPLHHAVATVRTALPQLLPN